jgi:protein FRA10AC1
MSDRRPADDRSLAKRPPRVENVVSEADRAILKSEYTFVQESSEEKSSSTATSSSWKERMVQRYHSGLYKEYALADLSRMPQIGLRWRVKQEVLDGRGELSCGNLHCPDRSARCDRLVTMEVPFAYKEKGVAKKELVKLRLCPICAPLVKKDNGRPSESSKDKEISKTEGHDPSKKRRSSYDGDDSETSDSSEERMLERRRRRKERRKLERQDQKRQTSK